MDTSDEVRLVSDWCSNEALCSVLRLEVHPDTGVRFEVRASERTFRSPTVDPTVLVALVGAASGSLGALIAGIMRILEKRQPEAGRIILRGADGTTVEAPATASPERMRQLAEIASKLEKPLIRLK